MPIFFVFFDVISRRFTMIVCKLTLDGSVKYHAHVLWSLWRRFEWKVSSHWAIWKRKGWKHFFVCLLMVLPEEEKKGSRKSSWEARLWILLLEWKLVFKRFQPFRPPLLWSDGTELRSGRSNFVLALQAQFRPTPDWKVGQDRLNGRFSAPEITVFCAWNLYFCAKFTDFLPKWALAWTWQFFLCLKKSLPLMRQTYRGWNAILVYC